MTPADSRYLRNASFFCSVACGGHAREGTGGQSSGASGRNETERNREPEDAARAAPEGQEALAKRRFDTKRASTNAFPDVDRPAFGAKSVTRRASEGTRSGFERNASTANGPRVASVRGTRTRALRPRAREVPFAFRNSIAKRRAVSRPRGMRRGRRGECKGDRRKRAADCVPYRLRSDRCARLGCASSARACVLAEVFVDGRRRSFAKSHDT